MRFPGITIALAWTFAACVAPTHASEASIFGDPLYVNGRRVTDDEIKLSLIYSLGRTQIELDKTAMLIDQELERQARERAEGAAERTPTDRTIQHTSVPLDRLDTIRTQLRDGSRIRDDELDAEYARFHSEFQDNYPTLDFGTELRRLHLSLATLREYLRQTLAFDRVFLPDDPDQWPTTTVQAVLADSGGGESLIQYIKGRRQERLDLAAASSKKPARPDELDSEILRRIVSAACSSLMSFKTQADGIAPGLVYWVDVDGDGQPEKTCSIDEMWPRVRESIDANEIAEAKQWCITARATRDRLVRDHAWLTPEERRGAIDELTRELRDNDSSVDEHASRIHFPSGESFLEYHVLRRSYERMREGELRDEPDGDLAPLLRKHFDRANREFGQGSVDAEVILVSAQDIEHFRWKEGGWSRARAAARDLRAALDSQQNAFERPDAERSLTPYEFWSEQRREHCDYWDLPLSMHMRGSSDLPRRRGGKFLARIRYALLEDVGETEYSEWVTGECITDHVFFDQPVDTVDGPFRGPLGWYLTRVNQRSPPTHPLDLSDPKHRECVKLDYLRRAFIEYSKEAVAQADIRGWHPPWGS